MLFGVFCRRIDRAIIFRGLQMRASIALLLLALVLSLAHSFFREKAFAIHLVRMHTSMELLAKPVASMARACPEGKAEFEKRLLDLTKDPLDWALIDRFRRSYEEAISGVGSDGGASR